MPVAHLGLTVSQIPVAAAFYLAALQPLGYRFIASRGDYIGLGVHDADFFLTQSPDGYRLAPTHVAFSATCRSAVRECYAAALRAGAYPSGPPSYRRDDCKCYNAAVDDPDGNTVEFVWRDKDLDDSRDDMVLSTKSYTGPSSTRSQTMHVFQSPRAGIRRSRTEPVESMSPKSLLGVVLGAAAAGAAVGLAMLTTERDSARQDARYSYSRSGHSRERGSVRSASVAVGSKSRRVSSAAGSRTSDRLPAKLVARQIEAKPYRDDEDISYARQKVTRHSQDKSSALEAIEYGLSRFSTRRSATMPVTTHSRRGSVDTRQDQESSYSNEAAYQTLAQTSSVLDFNSRRGSVADPSSRRDSVVGSATSKSYRSRERSSTSHAPTVRPTQVPLPPSIASVASTVRPARKSYFDAYYLPNDGEESDGLGDTATIVPDDSISCVNIPTLRKQKRSSSMRSSKLDSRNVMTIPMRPERDETTRGRYVYSNA